MKWQEVVPVVLSVVVIILVAVLEKQSKCTKAPRNWRNGRRPERAPPRIFVSWCLGGEDTVA